MAELNDSLLQFDSGIMDVNENLSSSENTLLSCTINTNESQSPEREKVNHEDDINNISFTVSTNNISKIPDNFTGFVSNNVEELTLNSNDVDSIKKSDSSNNFSQDTKLVDFGCADLNFLNSFGGMTSDFNSEGNCADANDEEFHDAVQFFKDPSSITFLENAGNASVPSDPLITRSSLYVTFDPLHAKFYSQSTKGNDLGGIVETEVFEPIADPQISVDNAEFKIPSEKLLEVSHENVPEIAINVVPELQAKDIVSEFLPENKVPKVAADNTVPEIQAENLVPDRLLGNVIPDVLAKEKVSEIIAKNEVPEIVAEDKVLGEKIVHNIQTEKKRFGVQAEYKVPEATAEYKVPEIQAEYKVPEMQADYKAPEIQAEYKMPEMQAEYKMPEIQADYKMPEIQADYHVPEIQAEYQVPEVLAENKVPDIAPESVMPEVLAEDKMLEVQGKYILPKIEGESMVLEVLSENKVPEKTDENVVPEIMSKTLEQVIPAVGEVEFEIVNKHLPSASPSPRVSFGNLLSFDSPIVDKNTNCQIEQSNEPPKSYTEEELQQALKIKELSMQDIFLKRQHDLELERTQKQNEMENEFKKQNMLCYTFQTILKDLYKIVLAQSEKESTLQDKLNEAEREITELKEDLKTSVQDLRNVENIFSDFHKRYEQCKSVLKDYTQNEENLKLQMEDLKVQINEKEEMYKVLQSRTQEMLDKANVEVSNAKKAGDAQIAVLKAQLKKAELKISSLESDNKHVRVENEKLSSICDELMAKVSES